MELFSSNSLESSPVSTSRIIEHLSRNLKISLNTILGFSDMLIDEEYDNEKKEKLVNIRRAGALLLDSIHDLLDFSFLTEGKIKPQSFYFSIRALVENLQHTRLAAIKGGSRVQFQISPGLPPVVLGDAYLLEKIIENNLLDILSFINDRAILVDISYRLGQLVLQIDAEDLCMIASLQEILNIKRHTGHVFSQFDEQFSRIIIARGLTSAMDGREYMDVDRKIIYIEIPLQAQENVSYSQFHENWYLSRQGLSSGDKQALCARKIAIIDDDKGSRRILSWLLLNHNYFPVVLRNDENVVEHIVESEIDLVIMELNMEGLDGFSINQMLKFDHRTANLPVLICSMDEEPESMLDYGVFDCIRKPIISADFMLKVDAALAMSGGMKNILVIDPDRQFLSVLKYHLHWENYQVFIFTTTEEAADSIQAGLQVNLALIDRTQALANQGQMIDLLREHMKDPVLPVIGSVFAGTVNLPDKRINAYITKDHNGCVQLIDHINGHFRKGILIGSSYGQGISALKMDMNSAEDSAILSALQGVQGSSWLIDEAIRDNI